MSEVTGDLEDLRRAADELANLALEASEAQLRVVTEAEGWPAGTVVHHIASVMPFVVDFALHIAGGGEITWTQEFIDSANETHAEFFEEVGAEEAVELLRENVAEALAKLGTLTAADLSRRAPSPLIYTGGTVWSAGDVVRFMLTEHIRSHSASIRRALNLGVA